MAKIGYIRVSTNDQNTDLQRNALISAECEQIFDDKMSGTKANRPGLKRALKALKTGDTLVVWKLDRLGRSVKNLVGLISELHERKNPLSKPDRQHRHQYSDGQILLSRHERPGGNGTRTYCRAYKSRSGGCTRKGPYWRQTFRIKTRPDRPD